MTYTHRYNHENERYEIFIDMGSYSKPFTQGGRRVGYKTEREANKAIKYRFNKKFKRKKKSENH